MEGTAESQHKIPHIIKSRNSNNSILLKIEVTTKQACVKVLPLGWEVRVERDRLVFTAFHMYIYAFKSVCACIALIKIKNYLKINFIYALATSTWLS